MPQDAQFLAGAHPAVATQLATTTELATFLPTEGTQSLADRLGSSSSRYSML